MGGPSQTPLEPIRMASDPQASTNEHAVRPTSAIGRATSVVAAAGPRMRRGAIALVAWAAALGAWAGASSQALTTLHLHFGAAQPNKTVWVSEPYVLTETLHGSFPNITTTAALVTNEATGVTTPLPPPHCQPTAMGGGWLLYGGCDPRSGAHVDAELYGLATGQWQSVTFNRSAATSSLDTSLSPDVVGTYWLGLSVGCYHCAAAGAEVYQNIATGQVWGGEGTGPHAQADPNLASLIRPVCRPLTVPVLSPGSFDTPEVTWGSITPVAGGLFVRSGERGSELVRCGSHRRMWLCKCEPTISRTLLLWQWGRRELRGVTLPSRRRVRVPLPAGVAARDKGYEYTLDLTSRNLYVQSERGLFIAPLR